MHFFYFEQILVTRNRDRWLKLTTVHLVAKM